jgi:hypothetical protein
MIPVSIKDIVHLLYIICAIMQELLAYRRFIIKSHTFAVTLHTPGNVDKEIKPAESHLPSVRCCVL